MARRIVCKVLAHPVEIRVYRDSETAEFVCRAFINSALQESSDYFTDDKVDAERTACAMAAALQTN